MKKIAEGFGWSMSELFTHIEDKMPKDFKIFDDIKHEGYYVKMAVAWAISVCLIKYYEDTIEYLKKSSCCLVVKVLVMNFKI